MKPSVLAALFLMFAPAAQAAPGEWMNLGSRQVEFAGERDTIVVSKVDAVFDAIRLEVNGGDLELYDLAVNFADGTRFSPDTRYEFKQGSSSRVIDLPGTARVIKNVSFLYRSKYTKKGRAEMTLWGHEARVIIAPAPMAPPIEPRWEMLGKRAVSFRAESDSIKVNGKGKEHMFTALRLEIDRGDVELYELVVHFVDGTKFTTETLWRFREGSLSHVIDLPGGARLIERVDFKYRSTERKGGAKLVLWGLEPN